MNPTKYKESNRLHGAKKKYEITDKMKVCPTCGNVYETFGLHGRRSEYYGTKGIPTYGKPRAICPRCKNKESEDVT